MENLGWRRPVGTCLTVHIFRYNRLNHRSVGRLGRQSVAWWIRGRVDLQQKHGLAVMIALQFSNALSKTV